MKKKENFFYRNISEFETSPKDELRLFIFIDCDDIFKSTMTFLKL